MIDVYNIIVVISGFCVLLIPIISVASFLFPKMRMFLIKKIQIIIGSQEIHAQLKDLTEKTKNLNNELNKHLLDSKKRLKTDLNLLRSDLIRMFEQCEERGYVTIEELEVLQEEYGQYVEIGGNGVIRHKWENVILKLPNSPISTNHNAKN